VPLRGPLVSFNTLSLLPLHVRLEVSAERRAYAQACTSTIVRDASCRADRTHNIRIPSARRILLQ
jgi:hypothetical protein